MMQTTSITKAPLVVDQSQLPHVLIAPLLPVNAAKRAVSCGACQKVTMQTLKRIGKQKFYVCACGDENFYFVVRP